ncbi:hypothetical protein ACFCVY_24005 [Streptomyces sp. NPDC056411]|uniref:hypothetical protein n=1 Tax=Streptomyces sp. NPDC056411 TaxID=3345813 RepID=UPI0035D8D1CA
MAEAKAKKAETKPRKTAKALAEPEQEQEQNRHWKRRPDRADVYCMRTAAQRPLRASAWRGL